jgi:hypothetical protein
MKIDIEQENKEPINWREQTRVGSKKTYPLLGIRLSKDENYVVVKTSEDEEGKNTLIFNVENKPEFTNVPSGVRIINSVARKLKHFGKNLDVSELFEELMNSEKNPVLKIDHSDKKGRLFIIG